MVTFEAGAAKALLESVRPGTEMHDCVLLAGGRNNRVYRLETSAGRFALKRYYSGGDWDRLVPESRFLRFCSSAGIHSVPELYAENAAQGVALHGWVDGRQPEPHEITAADITGAAAFLGELKAASRNIDLAAMPLARDACLSPEDFVCSLRERMKQLERAFDGSAGALEWKDAASFFRRKLEPAWRNARDLASSGCGGTGLATPFPLGMAVASPSDFGFHNSLRLADGTLRFIDFEYAGRDSAIKAIADFICQADYRIADSAACIREMAGAVCGKTEDADELGSIVRRILPLNRVKFCCILLNEFKSADMRRRRFSIPGDSDRLSRQLSKAKEYYESFL